MNFEIENQDDYKTLYLTHANGRLALASVALDVLRDSDTARAAWETLVGAALLAAETHAK